MVSDSLRAAAICVLVAFVAGTAAAASEAAVVNKRRGTNCKARSCLQTTLHPTTSPSPTAITQTLHPTRSLLCGRARVVPL
jgi:hypothetical protein